MVRLDNFSSMIENGSLPLTPHSCRRLSMKAVKQRRKESRLSKSEDCLEMTSNENGSVKATNSLFEVKRGGEGRMTRSAVDSTLSHPRTEADDPQPSIPASYSTWCVVRRGGQKQFGSVVRLRPRSMDVALLLRRQSGSPLLLPAHHPTSSPLLLPAHGRFRASSSSYDLDQRGKFFVMRRPSSLETIAVERRKKVGHEEKPKPTMFGGFSVNQLVRILE